MKSNPDRTTQDPAGYFPDRETAESYSALAVDSVYGQDRVRACRYVLSSPEFVRSSGEPLVVLDFGAGDGSFLMQLGLSMRKIYAVDPSPHMLRIAEDSFQETQFVSLEGSVECLADIPDASVDLALCIDVEGYLEEAELEVLYLELSRVTRKGGFLVVQGGNELFDLYALNAGTTEFFSRNFATDAVGLLTLSQTQKWSTAPRRNPLNFANHLASIGFEELAQGFSQWHEKIPSALVEFQGMDLLEARLAARNHEFDPNELEHSQRWKALFQCSMFVSLSQNVGAPPASRKVGRFQPGLRG